MWVAPVAREAFSQLPGPRWFRLGLQPPCGPQKSICTLNFTNRGGTMLVGTRQPETLASR